MDIKQLCEKISSYAPQLFLGNSAAHGEIFALQILSAKEGVLDREGHLLVGTLSAFLSQGPFYKISGAVCLKDIDYANLDSHISLILLPPSVDFSALVEELQEAINRSAKNAMYWSALLKAAIDHRDAQDLISIASNIFENPVILSDRSTKLIARSEYNISDSILWQDHTEHGYFRYETMQQIAYQKLRSNLDRGNIYLQQAISRYNTINKRILVNNIVIGTVSILDANRPFNAEDITQLEQLSKVLSFYWGKDNFYKFVKDSRRESFLVDIIEARIVQEEHITKRARSLDMRIDCSYLVAVAERPIQNNAFNISKVSEEIIRYLPFCYTLVYHGSILSIIVLKEGSAWKPSDELEAYLKSQHISMGFSRIANGLCQLRVQYQQARIACKSGKIFEKHSVVFPFDRYAICSLFLSRFTDANLQNYCSAAIDILADYDARKRTTYTETLLTFLKDNGNFTKTAQDLFIHRTSLVYRIKKIQEILNIDLTDSRIRNYLYISFLLSKLSREQKRR